MSGNLVSRNEDDFDRVEAPESPQPALLGQHYSGPIPPAAEVIRLNEVSAGLGTRIVEYHLAQLEHERTCDVANLVLIQGNAERADRWVDYVNRGQLYGFIALVLFLASAAYALWLGHVYVATLLISSGILGVVAKFIEGRPKADE